jgi:hypothetical protein
MREYLAEWLEENQSFSPMGPEHEDIPVRWEHFVKKVQEPPNRPQEELEVTDAPRRQTNSLKLHNVDSKIGCIRIHNVDKPDQAPYRPRERRRRGHPYLPSRIIIR